MSTDSRIGTEIAGYRVERLLGRGGMGRVYLAEDTRLGRKVALKLLDPELAEDTRFRDRFVRESRLAASLDHPNVIPIYEAGESDGVLFIAMRYVEGTDLARLLEEEGPLPPERTVAILTHVAAALDAAHRKGLIHRDVKPGNILVGEDDHTYLTDFGLIKRRETDTALTKTGQFMGSVDYAAPEQIEGTTVDGRADVYSLGCVAYECLTGEPPYPRDSEVAVLYAHLNDPVPRPTAKRPELPAAVDAVVAKAMAKRPEERYGSAEELAKALPVALTAETPRYVPLPRKSRPTGLVATVAGMIAVLVTVVTVLLTRGTPTSSLGVGTSGHASSTLRSSPTSAPAGQFVGVLAMDPETGQVAHRIEGVIGRGGNPTGAQSAVIASGEGGIWAADGGSVAHIDPADGSINTIPLRSPGPIFGISVRQGAVWAVEVLTLSRIDPATDQEIREIPTNPRLGVVTVDERVVAVPGSVWVGNLDGRLTRIDIGDNLARKPIHVASSIDALTYGKRAVWVMDKLDSEILKLDPRTGREMNSFDVNGELDALTVAFGSIWVVDSSGGTVVQVDPDTGEQVGSVIKVGDRPTDIAAGFRALWVTNQDDGTINRIVPLTHDTATISIGAPVAGVVADESSHLLWLVAFSPNGY
jgi:serine/threonine protein kinase/streptogramin lyase